VLTWPRAKLITDACAFRSWPVGKKKQRFFVGRRKVTKVLPCIWQVTRWPGSSWLPKDTPSLAFPMGSAWFISVWALSFLQLMKFKQLRAGLSQSLSPNPGAGFNRSSECLRLGLWTGFSGFPLTEFVFYASYANAARVPTKELFNLRSAANFSVTLLDSHYNLHACWGARLFPFVVFT